MSDPLAGKISLTFAQLGDMRHAVGGRPSMDPDRNYFKSDEDSESWNELVTLGLATKSDKRETGGGVYYHLTREGLQYIIGFCGEAKPDITKKSNKKNGA